MPKIIRILRSCSMKIFCKFPTVNISKLNFWLVICIAKNFIWTTLKMIFSIFRFFCTLRFQIFKYCSIITNHTSMESYLFSFQMMHKSQFHKIDPYDWFCAPGSGSDCCNECLSVYQDEGLRLRRFQRSEYVTSNSSSALGRESKAGSLPSLLVVIAAIFIGFFLGKFLL